MLLPLNCFQYLNVDKFWITVLFSGLLLTQVVRISFRPINGFRTASDYNATSHKWYCSDSHADPSIGSQTTVRDPNGRVAVLLGSDPNISPKIQVVS
ncbi:hypothetical protein B9Z55_016620 [Caenorhabditis nigoni]|nr:hypothetical protein B9Z55_016620 [Caenorhabditis nigoni]